MWYSESHPSQKPTLISYDEFLKITYPVTEDVGATSGKRPWQWLCIYTTPTQEATTDPSIQGLLCL